MFAPTTAATLPDAPAVTASGPWRTVSQVVEDLAGMGISVSERRVCGWIKRGVIEGSHPDRGVWLVAPGAIDRWIQAGQPRVSPDAAPRGRRNADPARIDATQGRRRPSRRASRSTDLHLV